MTAPRRFVLPEDWRPDEPVFAFHEDTNANAVLIHTTGEVFAVAEERLSRTRFEAGFPFRALAWIERESGVRAADVRTLVFGNRTHFLPRLLGRRFPSFEHDLFGLAHKLMLTYQHLCYISPRLAGWMEAVSRLLLSRRHPGQRFVLVDHHRAHAASAYYTGGRDEAVIVTADNFGDGYAATVYEGSNGALRFLYGSSAYHSPGQYYGEIAQIAGINPLLAGKLTGMAAHGRVTDAEPRLRALFDVADGATDFTRTFGWTRSRGTPPFPELTGMRRYDLAASAQRRLEDALIEYVRAAVRRTGLRHVALAGGCFANVRVNQEVMKLPEVESVWIHPAMSDQGIAFGAALDFIAARRGGRPFAMDSVFLGPEPTEDECRAALQAAGLPFERPENMARAAAELLAQGRVVARVAGPLEYGPRALGNRSIFYRANDPTIGDWLNRKLRRAHYMPFAPVVPAEHAAEAFSVPANGERPGRFMTIAYDAAEPFRKNSPGAVHVDGTVRPQILRESDNPPVHSILRVYHALTGLPGLINTSFNMHEEPIVCSATDACRAFAASGLDALILGPYLTVRAFVG